MYPGEEPPHNHHLPKMEDDDDDYAHETPHPPMGCICQQYDHETPYSPTGCICHQHQPPPPTPAPQQPLQPPKPLSSSPASRPPSRKCSTPTGTPPPPSQVILPPQPSPPQQPVSFPVSPPLKPHPPPQKHHKDDDDNNSKGGLLCGVITTLLILIGLIVLILWLLYRPSKPHFTVVSAAVYSLNTSSMQCFVATSIQITVITRNPSKRTSIYYDRLTVAVHYRNHPITPPAPLPPLHQRKRSAVMMSPVICGGTPVVVPPEVVAGLEADEAYGVVGLSWVLMGRVRYKVGWFKSEHSRVYVRCDVMVGFKTNGGATTIPSGQMPLLGNPPCFVDI